MHGQVGMPSGSVSALAQAADALASGDDLDGLLHGACEIARELTGARYAALGVIGDDEHLEQFIHAGMDDDEVAAIGSLPRGGGVLGVLVRRPEMLRLHRVGDHPASVGFPEHHPPMGNFLGVPVRSDGTVFGNLYLTEKPTDFDDADAQVVTVLAAMVGAAIAAFRSRRVERARAVQRERDRIARDLHDRTIQSLFGVTMTLDASADGTTDAATAAAIESSITTLQRVIGQLRNLTHDLHSELEPAASLAERIVRLARNHEAVTGHRPALELAGSRERHLSLALVDDIEMVVGELLSNAARHSGAEEVSVRLDEGVERIEVEVIDDGYGFDPESPRVGRGLDNIVARVKGAGGTFDVQSSPGHGTTVRLSFERSTP